MSAKFMIWDLIGLAASITIIHIIGLILWWRDSRRERVPDRSHVHFYTGSQGPSGCDTYMVECSSTDCGKEERPAPMKGDLVIPADKMVCMYNGCGMSFDKGDRKGFDEHVCRENDYMESIKDSRRDSE